MNPTNIDTASNATQQMMDNQNQIEPIQYQSASANTTMQTASGDWTMRDKLIFGLFAFTVLGGSIWFVQRFVFNYFKDKEANKGFEDGSAAAIARQIKMAFDNNGYWGTDEDALRAALKTVKTQEHWKDIVASYKKQYNQNLLSDISDELQTSEYNEMMNIITAKPSKDKKAKTVNNYTAWARRIKAAFDKTYMGIPGTDETALLSVFNEVPTRAAFQLTGEAYKKEFGTNIIEAMQSEAEFGQFEKWMSIIIKKPKK
jgi:hypothetical protein